MNNSVLSPGDESLDTPEKRIDSKARALEELNELGESLLKQSLSGTMSSTRSNSVWLVKLIC